MTVDLVRVMIMMFSFLSFRTARVSDVTLPLKLFQRFFSNHASYIIRYSLNFVCKLPVINLSTMFNHCAFSAFM